MENPSIFFNIFLIFTGAAIVATVALFARQAMIVAYIILGLILGPNNNLRNGSMIIYLSIYSKGVKTFKQK